MKQTSSLKKTAWSTDWDIVHSVHFVCVRRLDFKKVKGKEYSTQRKYGSRPIKK